MRRRRGWWWSRLCNACGIVPAPCLPPLRLPDWKVFQTFTYMADEKRYLSWILDEESSTGLFSYFSYAIGASGKYPYVHISMDVL